MLEGDLQSFGKLLALYGEATANQPTPPHLSREVMLRTILSHEFQTRIVSSAAIPPKSIQTDPIPRPHAPSSAARYRVIRLGAFGSRVLLGSNLSEAHAEGMQASISGAGEENVLMEREDPDPDQTSPDIPAAD